jgi:hypothetical protein
MNFLAPPENSALSILPHLSLNVTILSTPVSSYLVTTTVWVQKGSTHPVLLTTYALI